MFKQLIKRIYLSTPMGRYHRTHVLDSLDSNLALFDLTEESKIASSMRTFAPAAKHAKLLQYQNYLEAQFNCVNLLLTTIRRIDNRYTVYPAHLLTEINLNRYKELVLEVLCMVDQCLIAAPNEFLMHKR